VFCKTKMSLVNTIFSLTKALFSLIRKKISVVKTLFSLMNTKLSPVNTLFSLANTLLFRRSGVKVDKRRRFLPGFADILIRNTRNNEMTRNFVNDNHWHF
jgi:hypothetical protein